MFVAIVFVVASVHLVARNSALLERVFVQAPLERGFRVFGGPDRIATDYHSNAFAPECRPTMEEVHVAKLEVQPTLHLVGVLTAL